jgi:hypothetical protein
MLPLFQFCELSSKFASALHGTGRTPLNAGQIWTVHNSAPELGPED